MYAQKLHTRQYHHAGFSRHAVRAMTALATLGLAAWSGSGMAHADSKYERQACALMDDYATAISKGYSSYPAQYAFTVLSTELPPEEAGHVLAAATHDDCPNHAADLPSGWR